MQRRFAPIANLPPKPLCICALQTFVATARRDNTRTSAKQILLCGMRFCLSLCVFCAYVCSKLCTRKVLHAFFATFVFALPRFNFCTSAVCFGSSRTATAAWRRALRYHSAAKGFSSLPSKSSFRAMCAPWCMPNRYRKTKNTREKQTSRCPFVRKAQRRCAQPKANRQNFRG